MFYLRIFALLVCSSTFTNSDDIQVLSSGMSKLSKNDMMVVFYVTVKHFGKNPLRTMATCIECCENIIETDIDCDIMDVFGGDFGIIYPGRTVNITFIYPNLYGYNRKGYCLFKILSRDTTNEGFSEVKQRVHFDTRFNPHEVPQVLTGFYEPESFVQCETPDLDPIEHCHPVNCQLKYGGHRNFYNSKSKMCERVPKCLSDPRQDFPNVVYRPEYNQCQDLDKLFSPKEMKKLARGDFIPHQEQTTNIRCQHGKIDPKTKLCVCDYGWKSEPFILEAETRVKSMCTLKCTQDEPYKNLPLWLGLILALWFFFLVSWCEWKNFFVLRRYYIEQEQESSTSWKSSGT